MASSGSTRKSGSGNRRPPGTGNRSAATRRSGAPAAAKPAGAAKEENGSAPERLSSEERARERLGQQRGGSKRPQSRGGSRPGKIDPRKRRPQQRSTGKTAGIFGGAFVALAVIIIILISTLSSSGTASKTITFQLATPAIVSGVTHVPASELAAAGLGGSQVSVAGAFAKPPGQAAITEDGKPVLVYEGAEYCPFCAAARWPLVIALSRFGTFSGLGTIGSSAYDVYASTHTFSFARAHYTSPYLVFSPTEFESNVCAPGALVSTGCEDYVALQSPDKKASAAFTKYDTAKYFPAAVESSGGTSGWIPFFDWGGKFVESGGLYSPGLITLGSEGSKPWLGWHPLTWSEIIKTFTVPTSGTGQAILGAANYYTAAICDITNNKPASICNTALMRQAEKGLPS